MDTKFRVATEGGWRSSSALKSSTRIRKASSPAPTSPACGTAPTHESAWTGAGAGWPKLLSSGSGLRKPECVYVNVFETGSELNAGLGRWIGIIASIGLTPASWAERRTKYIGGDVSRWFDQSDVGSRSFMILVEVMATTDEFAEVLPLASSAACRGYNRAAEHRSTKRACGNELNSVSLRRSSLRRPLHQGGRSQPFYEAILHKLSKCNVLQIDLRSCDQRMVADEVSWLPLPLTTVCGLPRVPINRVSSVAANACRLAPGHRHLLLPNPSAPPCRASPRPTAS